MIKTIQIFIFTTLILIPYHTFASPFMLLHEHKTKYLMGQYLDIYEDKEGKLAINDIASENFSKNFKQIKKDAPSFGFTSSVFWVRFQVTNFLDSKKNWLLELSYPLMDRITIYEQKNKGEFTAKEAGYIFPFNKREISHRNFIFKLNLEPFKIYTYYMSFKNKDRMEMPLILWESERFFTEEHFEQHILGIYYGILYVMILYNFLLYISLRDKSYLYYVLCLIVFIIYQLTQNGLFYEYYFPAQFSQYNHYIPFISSILIFCILLFTQSFLHTKENTPKLNTVLSIFKVIAILSFFDPFIFNYALSIKIVLLLAMSSILIILLTGTYHLFFWFRPAIFFMSAWTFALIAGIIYSLKIFAILPTNWFTSYSIQLGSAIEGILLSLGLGDRINILMKEKETAQEEAIENLHKTDELKDEFLANTSHELRTPLNGIIGIAESLLDGASGRLNHETRKNLNMIVLSGKRLSSLVNDILDFSKLKNKELKLNKRPVDLRQLTEVVLMLLSPLAKTKNLELKNEIPENIPYAYGDENRLQQIFNNLIGNAIKFTSSGSISASCKAEENFLKISISDTGIGIPSEKYDDIFKSFEQLDGSIEREYGGTGLGLAITKSLVELHEGKIWVEKSELGKGSVFSFTLLVADVDEKIKYHVTDKIKTVKEALKFESENYLLKMGIISSDTENIESLEKKIPEELKGIKALVVDDESVNLQVIKNNLKLAEVEVETTDSGILAIEIINNIKPDIILLDVMMPKLNGFETALQIRKNFPKEELPIIFLTAKNQTSDLLDGFAAGGNDYITKPISRHELFTRMSFHIGLSKSRKALKKAEKEYRRIFENAAEGIFQFLPDGKIINANPAMAKILGYDSPDELRLKVSDIAAHCSLERSDWQKFRQMFIDKGQVSGFEMQGVRKNNNIFWGSLSASAVKGNDGQILYYEAMFADITERKEKETAEREKETAQAATKAKSEFLANMSHEIRTPMNAIIGFADLALKNNLSDKQKAHLEKISYSAKTLMGIINDILDFSKIEAGKLELDSSNFKLNEVIDNISDMFYKPAFEKKIGLIINIGDNVPLSLIGDSLRLRQILINLMNNAIKFTEKGEVALKVALEKITENEKVILNFSVKDTGIGIDSEQIPKLFQAFIQAEGSKTTKKFGGTGLGLTICKQLVELMGGSVKVESKLQEGSIFSFNAVFIKQSGDESLNKNITEKNKLYDKSRLSGIKVLLAEDNFINQELASELLQIAGVIVTIASNGKEAVENVLKNDFDAVLMDIQMPEMDGFEAAISIRENEKKSKKTNRLPIIAMTANAMKGDREQSINAGMDDHITKPIDIDELYSTLLKWTKNSEKNIEVNLLPKQKEAIENDIIFPDSLNGIDITSGLKRAAGNKELYKKILKDFSQDYSDSVETIRYKLKNNDKEETKRLVHTIKGVVGNIAAKRLYEITIELEKSILQDDYSITEQILEKFDKELKQVISSINHLEQDKEKRKKEKQLLQNPSDIFELLIKLKNMLEINDLDADELLDEIEEQIDSGQYKEIFEKLKKHINKLDFENALITLNDIIYLKI